MKLVLGNGQDVFTDVVRCNKLNWMALDGVGEEEVSVKPRSATATKVHHVRSAVLEKIWWNAVLMSRYVLQHRDRL